MVCINAILLLASLCGAPHGFVSESLRAHGGEHSGRLCHGTRLARRHRGSAIPRVCLRLKLRSRSTLI